MTGRLLHSFHPLAHASSRILILGSMPGEESLRQRQYYAFRRNAFWRIIAAATGSAVPSGYAEKKRLLKDHGIALWDVIKTCRRAASSDARITDVTPNDIPGFLARHPCIAVILLNGRTAEKLYTARFAPRVPVPHVCLPSTSPAHAALTAEKKLALWRRHLGGALTRRIGRG